MDWKTKKPPAAPPVYRPQPVPKVLQRKSQANHTAQIITGLCSIRPGNTARAIQLAERRPSPEKPPFAEETHQQKLERQRLRRQARSNVTITKAEDLHRIDEHAKQLEATTARSVEILKQLKGEDWVMDRVRKTQADIDFEIRAGLGETTRGQQARTNDQNVTAIIPLITLGNEALTDIKMGRITLRHELDHAKLQRDFQALTLGKFKAFYNARDPHQPRPGKDHFEYELEELIVRLRDWRRLGHKTEETTDFTQAHARQRIKDQFKKLINTRDKDEYDPENVADIMRKLAEIAEELKVDLQ